MHRHAASRHVKGRARCGVRCPAEVHYFPNRVCPYAVIPYYRLSSHTRGNAAHTRHTRATRSRDTGGRRPVARCATARHTSLKPQAHASARCRWGTEHERLRGGESREPALRHNISLATVPHLDGRYLRPGSPSSSLLRSHLLRSRTLVTCWGASPSHVHGHALSHSASLSNSVVCSII